MQRVRELATNPKPFSVQSAYDLLTRCRNDNEVAQVDHLVMVGTEYDEINPRRTTAFGYQLEMCDFAV